MFFNMSVLDEDASHSSMYYRTLVVTTDSMLWTLAVFLGSQHNLYLFNKA
ncbi:hypothetical protein ACZ87_03717 [Candidatus Erwinia dacicola]|uniref:Uncharacterized protein n=1 Tax=Candidatus Erwinia dacicola TaxID=252393 RepID=A0A328TNU1_9GAMM|nr:hypothetical protein ACZ87_03717 [Candidatus Erwinia dacicola]